MLDTQRDSVAELSHHDDGLGPGVMIDQYELIRELGRGGMGVVFAARDTRLGRRVAIKFVLKATGEIAQRFMNEARALARCEHPNIVVIHAVDEHEGLPYLVLEFLEGHSLRELMKAAPRLPPTRVVELLLPVARALELAHAQDIVHRDLKPENVIVTNAGEVKVLDFGIAKAESSDPNTPRLTGQHSLLGTLAYMSPEQMNSDVIDGKSDVWALGLMMFEMLAGQHPVQPLVGGNLVANAISDDPMPALGSMARDVPAAIARIVDACLVKDHAQRMSMHDVVGALDAVHPARRTRTLGADENPFPGLAAFQETDAGRFFGRDAEIARMTARVREWPLSGVIGPSGAGKSSFIRAGVGPALKASGERWEIHAVRPGRMPMAALGNMVQRATAPVDRNAQTSAPREQLVRRMRSEPGYLGSLLRAHARRTDQRVLLFVDQLEELFTLVSDPSERQAFTAALLGAADDPSAPVRVVVSIRSDFVDRLVEYGSFVEELSRSILLMSTPDRDGLRAALEQPLAVAGYAFESADIIEDMLTALDGVSGALPLLQFAAAKLWDGRDTERKLITQAGYAAIGGLSGALATHADEVMGRFDTAAQRTARRILRALVTPERTRAVLELDELYAGSDRGEVARVLDQLVSARLVVVQKRAGGGGTAELVHESLIERWPTLRRWIDEDHEDAAFTAQLAVAARQWDSRGRSADLLWRGDAADELRRWLLARPRELVPRDQAFADAVVELRGRGARRRRRGVIAGFVALGTVAAGAVVALLQINAAREEALRNAQTADRNAQIADKNAQTADKNAQLWREAASALDAKEREKALAEARRADAERGMADATARAEHDKQLAQSAVKEKESQVVESREALQQKNQQLEGALRDQRAATERAEHATADAQKAQVDAQRAAAEAERTKAELQKALDKEKKRADALAEERRKLSTTLKE